MWHQNLTIFFLMWHIKPLKQWTHRFRMIPKGPKPCSSPAGSMVSPQLLEIASDLHLKSVENHHQHAWYESDWITGVVLNLVRNNCSLWLGKSPVAKAHRYQPCAADLPETSWMLEVLKLNWALKFGPSHGHRSWLIMVNSRGRFCCWHVNQPWPWIRNH